MIAIRTNCSAFTGFGRLDQCLLGHVKLILRSECVVVSFHEDEGSSHDEDE